MHQKNTLVRSVQKNLWSRGYQVKTPVPATDHFDLVVNGFRVLVQNKMPTDTQKWDLFDVIAIVEMSKVTEKAIISYYKGDVVSIQPQDIFNKNNEKSKKSKSKKSAKSTEDGDSGKGRVGAHNSDN